MAGVWRSLREGVKWSTWVARWRKKTWKQVFFLDTFLPVTGHADGSVRFWDTTGTAMQQLHRLRTQKLFEKNKVITFSYGKVFSRGKWVLISQAGGMDALEEDPYAITHITLSKDCRTLAVAGQTAQILLYRLLFLFSFQINLTSDEHRFRKKDCQSEIPCLEIPIIYEVSLDRQADGSPHFEFPPRPPLVRRQRCSKINDEWVVAYCRVLPHSTPPTPTPAKASTLKSAPLNTSLPSRSPFFSVQKKYWQFWLAVAGFFTW